MEVKSIRSDSMLVFQRFLCDVMYSHSRSMDGNYSTLDSHTNTVISHTFAYTSKWRLKP